jgi:L-rhamnose mutarotase
MKRHFARLAAAAVTLAGIALIASGCGQAASKEAEASKARLQAVEAERQAARHALETARAEAATAKTTRGAAKVETTRPRRVRRFGSVIGLKPEMKDKYVKLHAKTWPSVLDRIRKSNIRNYSIYLAELEGKLYLFSYYEYVGDDYKADMQKIADDPETQRWWKETDPCQIRLPGTPEGEQWLRIQEVFHTD